MIFDSKIQVTPLWCQKCAVCSFQIKLKNHMAPIAHAFCNSDLVVFLWVWLKSDKKLHSNRVHYLNIYFPSIVDSCSHWVVLWRNCQLSLHLKTLLNFWIMDLVQNDEFVIVQRKSQVSLHQLPKKQGKKWYVSFKLHL